MHHWRGLSKLLPALIVWSICIGAAPHTEAQEAYPDKPIHLVVPFAAGGAADLVARLIGDSMSKKLGQTIVVDNRPGATGAIGSLAVARAAPDGYTILMAVISSHVVVPATKSNPAFDPVKDFSPIVRVANSVQTLVARTSFPAGNLKAILEHAKLNPGRVSYGSSGLASFPWLGAMLMERQAGIQMIHVPFTGDGPAMSAIGGGQIDLLFTPSAQTYVDGGIAKVMGIASLKRSAATPNWPTLDEGGLPGFTLVSWVGFMAPTGTPPQRVDILNRAVNEALTDETIKARLQQIGYDPAGGSPDEYRNAIQQDIDRIRALGIRFD